MNEMKQLEKRLKEPNHYKITIKMEKDYSSSITVYSMNLHETITVAEGILVTRVPGGWIYEFQKPEVNVLELVFVPFNNEFQIAGNTENKIFE